MKKINLLTLLFLMFIVTSMIAVAEETECPFGFVNDTAPGQCVLYDDGNSNNICDLSEPHNCTADASLNNPEGIELSGEQLKTLTVEQAADAYNIDKELFAIALGKLINTKVSPKDSLLLLHDNNALGMSDVKAVAAGIASDGTSSSVETITKSKTQYYFIPLVLISIFLYISTFILSKKGVISLILHRKIWNWLLLVFFLATSFFAIIYLLNAEYNMGIRLPINTSYWHIITGIVTIMISVFHIWWHLNYYFVKKHK